MGLIATVLAGLAGETLSLLTKPHKESLPTEASLVSQQKLSSLLAGASTVGHATNLDAIAAAHGLRLSQEQADYLEKNKFLLVPLSPPRRQVELRRRLPSDIKTFSPKSMWRARSWKIEA